ncbi:MAG: hypothetical protein ACOC0U_06755 [Desulfovibrionales bacterium]
MKRLAVLIGIIMLVGATGCATRDGDPLRSEWQGPEHLQKKEDIRQNCLGGGFGTLYCKDPGMR